MKQYGLKIVVKPDDDISYVLKKFKKRVDKSGVLELYKSKQTYMKPSDKKKLKRK